MFEKIFKKDGLKLLKINLFLVIMFAILYYVTDHFNNNNFDLAQRIFFVRNDIKKEDYYTPGSLDYYLWHSLITQTTVGYGGVVTSGGKSISWSSISSNIYKVLNILQLVSIFIIPTLIL